MKGLQKKSDALQIKGRKNYRNYDASKNGAYYRLGELQTDQAYLIKKFIESMADFDNSIIHQIAEVERRNNLKKSKL